MPRIFALPPMISIASTDVVPIVDVSEATTKKVTINMIQPTGAVVDFAGANAPSGWLLCYGQSLNATSNPEYADLFAVIGVTYGGSGITAFNVPDARGRVIAGADAMGGTAANRLTSAGLGVTAVRGAVGGAEIHTLTTGQMPVHGLSWTIHGQENGTDVAGQQVTGGSTSGGVVARYGNHGAGFTGANSIQTPGWSFGSGQAHNNTQPTLVMNKIIKF